MDLEDALKKDKDDPTHPDNLPGDIAHNLYDEPDVGGEKEHEARIDLEYEKNREDYNKE